MAKDSGLQRGAPQEWQRAQRAPSPAATSGGTVGAVPTHFHAAGAIVSGELGDERLPERLQEFAPAIDGDDCNLALESGWWAAGAFTANAPASSSWVGQTIRFPENALGDFSVQMAYEVVGAYRIYRRTQNIFWNAWEQIDRTFYDTRYAPVYKDDTGTFTDYGAAQTIVRRLDVPTAWTPTFMVKTVGGGDNTTFIGVASGYFTAEDRPDVTAGTKGVLYALEATVRPLIDRDNVPYDDVVGVIIENHGSARGTDGFYMGHNRSDVGGSPLAQDWANAIQIDAHADNMIRSIGRYGVGISLSGAEFTVAAIRLGNTDKVSWLKADGTTLQPVLELDSSDILKILDGALRVFIGGGAGIPNNTAYQARNAANSAYLEIARITASDNVTLYNGKVNILGLGGETIAAAGSIPSAPSAGVVARYSNGGTYQAKTSTGTVTTLAGDVVTKSANATLTLADQVVLGTGGGGGITITLPTAVNAKGQRHIVKKVDAGAGAVTLGTTSSQTIDGATTKALAAQYDRATVISDGANWHVIG